MATLAPRPPQRLRRWDPDQNEWHRHALEHAHDEAGDHQHVFATDPDTLQRLQRLLHQASTRPLTADERREAEALLDLTR